MTRRSDTDAALQALYDRIPVIPDCTGECWVSCGPIEMSRRERERITEAGYDITPGAQAALSVDTFWCEALTAGHRCAVYALRPLSCRLWGAVESMPCPFGCTPVPCYLSDEEGHQLIAESIRVGGYLGVDAGLLLEELRRGAAWHARTGSGGVALRRQYALPPGLRRRREVGCPHCGFVLTVPDGWVDPGLCGNCHRVVCPEDVLPAGGGS